MADLSLSPWLSVVYRHEQRFRWITANVLDEHLLVSRESKSDAKSGDVATNNSIRWWAFTWTKISNCQSSWCLLLLEITFRPLPMVQNFTGTIGKTSLVLEIAGSMINFKFHEFLSLFVIQLIPQALVETKQNIFIGYVALGRFFFQEKNLLSTPNQLLSYQSCCANNESPLVLAFELSLLTSSYFIQVPLPKSSSYHLTKSWKQFENSPKRFRLSIYF